MAELVAMMVRGLQLALGLMILCIFLSPLIMAIAPLLWAIMLPILIIGSLIGLFGVLGSIASRLEETEGK